MDFGLSGLTGKVVEYALDGLALRHSAIASNIANADSIGFRPLKVSFEQHLAALLTRETGASRRSSAMQPMPRPVVSVDVAAGGFSGQQSLEMQAVRLNENVVQYQALIRGLDRYMATLSTAINEGRR